MRPYIIMNVNLGRKLSENIFGARDLDNKVDDHYNNTASKVAVVILQVKVNLCK